MPQSPPLRPARPGDAEAMAALIRLAFAAQPVATDPPPSALRESAGALAAHFAGGGGGVLAEAPADAGAVAALLWAEREDGLHLSRLAVHPGWRRRGLARLLLAEAERVARGRGRPALLLSTRLALPANRRLFAACGFSEAAFRAHPGHDRPTFVEMEKRLG